ncbi:MAG: retropepsin-like aspartic protease [Planctomycetota bacterium]
MTRFTPPLTAAALVLAAAPLARAQATRDLGRADGFAIDQPRVVVRFDTPDDSQNFPEDPNGGFTFIADTGASGVLLAAGAHSDLFSLGTINYPIAGTYLEQGVGGFEPVDVTDPLDTVVSAFSGLDAILGGSSGGLPGDITTFELPNIAGLDAPNLNLGGFDGIIGMPALANRTTVVDLQTISGGSFGFDLIRVGFTDDASGLTLPTGTQHEFSFSKFLIQPEAGQVGPDGPIPSSEDLPLLGGISVGNGDTNGDGLIDSGDTATTPTAKPFLFDTGAQLTLISSQVAIDLGIDPNDPTLETLEVAGVGGTTEIPVALVDRFAITADSTDGSPGDTLLFRQVPVGIIDIPGLDVDGILGFNFFTTGYLDALLAGLADPDDPAAAVDGAFLQMLLNFEDPDNWGMTLIENDDYIPGDSIDLLGDLDALALTLFPGTPLETEIGLGTGLANQALLSWPGVLGASAIPEPTTALALLAAAPMFLRRRHAATR